MEVSRSHPPSPAWGPWKAVAAATLGVVLAALAVTVPTMLCRWGGGSAGVRGASEGLAWLEETLDVTSRSLTEAREQWDGCRKELGVLERKVLELEQTLDKVTQLEEENRELRMEVSWQREQLEQEQSRREELQLQNQALQNQLGDMRSPQTSENSILNKIPSSLCLFIFLLWLLLKKCPGAAGTRAW